MTITTNRGNKDRHRELCKRGGTKRWDWIGVFYKRPGPRSDRHKTARKGR